MYNCTQELEREGKEYKEKKIPIRTLLEWVSQWINTRGTPERIDPLFEQYFPPLFRPDGTRREDKRKQDILDCMRRNTEAVRSLPFLDTVLSYNCPRCGQKYSSCTSKPAKKHESLAESKCICLLRVPFFPRPPNSEYNHTIEPIGEKCATIVMTGGSKQRAIVKFREKLSIESHYEIEYRVTSERRSQTFRGDYRDLICAPMYWLS